MKGRQKLKTFFINRKVDRHKRELWPILADSEEILWVAGLRTGRKASIESGFLNLLKVELLLAK